MTTSVAVKPLYASRWPVLFAPIVASVYYLAVKVAFAQSIIPVLGRSDFFDLPHWGSHWIYRVAAEVIAVAVGAFVAAGLAPGRERAAAIAGGCTIALGFIGKLLLTFWVWESDDSGTVFSVEPRYQRAIDGAMIFAAPIVALFITDAAEQMHRDTPNGFGGINRFHLLWLWFAAYCYSLGIVTPIAWYYAHQDGGAITSFLILLINGIPGAAIAIPGYYGLALLAGHHGNTMHPAGRNLIGILVLVFGFLVGLLIQESWYWLVQKVVGVILG